MPEFKQRLRRELLEQGEQARVQRSLWPAWSLATFSLACLVLFVVFPGLPQRLNQMLTGNQVDLDRQRLQAGQIEALRTMNRELNIPRASGLQSGDSGFLQVGAEQDKAYVESWLQEHMGKKPAAIRNAGEEQVMTLREFVTEDGKKILVLSNQPVRREENSGFY